MIPVYKTVGALSATLPSDREIRITRRFNAPRQLVWDAHTQPALIKRWLLGPPGWTMPVCDVDLRVGGKYRFEWHSEKGMAMALSGVYREIEAPNRIADTQRFDDDWTKGEADTTLTLEDKDGGTVLTLNILYASKDARDTAAATPMLEGMEAGYARMEGVMA
ncbi:MAG TPA: SRPBCC family protein [Asticcacaulis sp.]|nr:SRPBCC family protein [Asticcacaulis sp.]